MNPSSWTRNPLAGVALDRMAERREDPQWLDQRAKDPLSQYIVVHRGRILMEQLDTGLEIARLAADVIEKVDYLALLGVARDRSYFAIGVDQTMAARLSQKKRHSFRELREVVPALNPSEASLLAYARGLDLWQRAHRYCGRCGHATKVASAGFRRVCTNAECAAEHYPRLDPAVIVIVEHAGRCLLGRQPSWDAGRYSTLAGFVEPGESLEEAVVREVAEEAGVVVDQVSYHSSQPWPFPSSIMIGFMAAATQPDIRLGDELEDARWFKPSQLESAVRSGQILLPWPSSVSHRLIADWFRLRHDCDIRGWSRPQ